MDAARLEGNQSDAEAPPPRTPVASETQAGLEPLQHPPAQSSPAPWWTPTKTLVAFAITVGVLVAGAVSTRSGLSAVAYVLLNPVLWVAAVLAGSLLWRRGRRDLAAAVTGLSAVAILGFVAIQYSGSVVATAKPPAIDIDDPTRSPTPLEMCLEAEINSTIEDPAWWWSAPFGRLEWERVSMFKQDSLQICRDRLGIATPPP